MNKKNSLMEDEIKYKEQREHTHWNSKKHIPQARKNCTSGCLKVAISYGCHE